MTLARPTLFISYASEDREAVRLLRSALEASGLDVWYDENELGGGDAWDQKIRRQIRDCDFFMPVISATTERRKEGYFRREWRLAVERTLDMADDVMFLVPICLDDTDEFHARVPEKFMSVQWLRVAGGVPTPALATLARKLAAGDHAVPPLLEKPPAAKRPARDASSSSKPPRQSAPAHEAEPDGPPPMPPFPHMAEKANIGHGFKFMAEVIWWGITAAWLLFKRAPRWLRVLLTIWFVFFLFSRCNRSETETPAHESKKTSAISAEDKAEAREAVRLAAEKLSAFGKEAKGSDVGSSIAKFGSEIAKNLAAQIKDDTNTHKQILAVPFALGVTNEADAKFLSDVFTPLYGQLAVARSGETGLLTEALPVINDESLVAAGVQFKADYVLAAQLVTENSSPTLKLRLMKTADATVAWSADYPLADRPAAPLASEIATAVLKATATTAP